MKTTFSHDVAINRKTLTLCNMMRNILRKLYPNPSRNKGGKKWWTDSLKVDMKPQFFKDTVINSKTLTIFDE